MISLEWDLIPHASAQKAFTFVWGALKPRQRIRYWMATGTSAALALLDLVAIAVLAALTGYVASLVTSANGIQPLFNIPSFGLSPTTFIVVVGLAAAVLLAAKSALSWWAYKRVQLFIAGCIPRFASAIYRRYVAAPFPAANALTTQEVLTSVDTGSSAMGSVLTGVAALVTEIVLLAVLSVLLVVASPLLFVCSIIYFGLITFVIAQIVGNKAAASSRTQATASLQSSQAMSESVGFAREVRLYGLAEGFIDRLESQQSIQANAGAIQQALFQVPRYVLETALVMGFALAAGIAFATQSPDRAAVTIGVFLITSTRIVPSLQRMNGVWGSLKLAVSLLWMMSPVMDIPVRVADRVPSARRHEADSNSIKFEGVGYAYPGSDEFAVHGIDLTIPKGSRVALVGHTGAGKSTLAELALGLVEPTEGVIASWFTPGPSGGSPVAVVPQDVYVAPDSVRNNVSLGSVGQRSNDEDVWEALAGAQIDDVIRALPMGLDTELGERGARLSGGEVQRVGLARALYRKPELLVLDEATSALDAETEGRVAAAIAELPGDITVVTIAHRLATVRSADLVVLLTHGSLLGVGTFEDLVAEHPELARAAVLQGLLARDAQPGSEISTTEAGTQ